MRTFKRSGGEAIDVQRWLVGEYTVTSIVEDEVHHIPPELFFPAVRAEDVARHSWLVPEFADAQGHTRRPVRGKR